MDKYKTNGNVELLACKASDREKFRKKIYENAKGIDEVLANALVEIAWNARIISEMLDVGYAEGDDIWIL